MLLGTSFIDRIIRNIFPAELKVVSWLSHPVAWLSVTQRSSHICASTPNIAATLVKPSNDDKGSTYPVGIARQTILEPHSKHCAIVTTTASGFSTVEPRAFNGAHQVTPAIHSVTNILLSQAFQMPVTNYFAKGMNISKDMMVLYATRFSTIVTTDLSAPLHYSSMRTSRV